MTGDDLPASRPGGIPRVSVVMAVYNGERYIREAVESVLNQTMSEFELVVVDDGSNDRTGSILAGYADADTRVVLLNQENSGQTAALNRGIASARSAIIARLDADDIAVPERLALQTRYLIDHPEVAVVGGAVVMIDADGRPFAHVEYPTTDEAIRDRLRSGTPFEHSAVAFRKFAFDAVGGYRLAFGSFQDIDLWVRMSERFRLANLCEEVVHYRIHPEQATVRRLDFEVLCAVAARAAAMMRAHGEADPFGGSDLVDERTVRSLGVTTEELTEQYVRLALWLGRTAFRAGYDDLGEQHFQEAARRARSSSGSAELGAAVHASRAKIHDERGERVRGVAERVRARLAARRVIRW